MSNFTPVPRENYRIGVSQAGHYVEILNTDAKVYCGSNVNNAEKIHVEDIASHGKEQSIALHVPPLATVYLRFQRAQRG